jgi:hypothetical protein
VFHAAYAMPTVAGSVASVVSHGIAAKAAVRPTMPTADTRKKPHSLPARAGRRPSA